MNAGEAALISAIAAVLGALVGAGGALGSAAITGRNQARTQNEHWRRQVQRDAYAALMGAVADCILAVDAAIDAAVRPLPSDMQEKYAAARDSIDAVRRAGNLVYLEGPVEVAGRCADLIHSLDHWHRGTIGLHERTRSEGGGPDMIRARTQALNALERFQSTARDVLDGFL